MSHKKLWISAPHCHWRLHRLTVSEGISVRTEVMDNEFINRHFIKARTGMCPLASPIKQSWMLRGWGEWSLKVPSTCALSQHFLFPMPGQMDYWNDAVLFLLCLITVTVSKGEINTEIWYFKFTFLSKVIFWNWEKIHLCLQDVNYFSY